MVGSTAHGLAIGGSDDRDEMGVCVEPPERVIGLNQFEQHLYRTAWVRTDTGPSTAEQPRSEAGDLDLTVYYLRLAVKGSPSILALLYVRPDDLLVRTPLGDGIQALAPKLISRRAGKAFLGYMTAQRERLTGERGRQGKVRREFSPEAGYDTKYAMHMLRLGYQGVQLLEAGEILLPMWEYHRDLLLRVRKGEMALDVVLNEARALESKMERLIGKTRLPAEADQTAVDAFLVDAYREVWGW